MSDTDGTAIEADGALPGPSAAPSELPGTAVYRAPRRDMVTLRGAADDLRDSVDAVSGLALPDRLRAAIEGDRGLLWMAPDEWLLLLPAGTAGVAVATLTARLGPGHTTVADVSDARVAFRIEGPHWREVLAKLTPADMSPGAFGLGDVRRTRVGQVAAAVWPTPGAREPAAGAGGAVAADLLCFASVADYTGALLRDAARPGTSVAYWTEPPAGGNITGRRTLHGSWLDRGA